MKNKREGFVDGVISLMFSQVIIKIFGLAYSMYLINKDGFGDSGNAIYMGGYQIYVLLLTISSIGVPNAIAKLVSEKIARNDYRGANKVFKVAFLSFGIIGFCGTLILFFQAKNIANHFLLIPECEYSLIALSPSIFFVSIGSVIRGYFNGIQKISKTAKSQTIEQICKSICTIIFVEILSIYSKDTKLLAGIANFASTFSIFISFIYIFISYRNLRKIEKMEEIKQRVSCQENIITILRRIFAASIPITFSAILSSLSKNIDSLTVVRILTPILGETTAKLKYGILSSKVDMLTLMPLSFNIAFATALIPAISSAQARNDMDSINKKLSFSLLITVIIAFPSAIGLSLYSKQILELLFPNASNGAELLRLSAFCIIFMALTQTIGGALHGIGKSNVSAIALLIGIVVKLLLNIILIPLPNLYEKGAVIGNLFSNIITFIIVWGILKRSLNLNFKLYKIIIKPLFATGIMAGASYSSYVFLISNGVGSRISTILGICFAIFVYAFIIFSTKIFSKEELFLLPKGEKIYYFFKMLKIYS